MMRRLKLALSAPLRTYFDARFGSLQSELAHLAGTLSAVLEVQKRADALDRVQVTSHNREGSPPTFEHPVSQVVSLSQFREPSFQRLASLLTGCSESLPWSVDAWPPGRLERKLWEWCFILRAAELQGLLEPGRKALGFGVGEEPIPAALAHLGVRVCATDIAPEQAGGWAETHQHMSGLASLSRPKIIGDAELAELVETRPVDMSAIPSDIGKFDLVWSSGSLEHLGSAERGLEFVLNTIDLLEPGGLAVHTTELELTERATTADHGHLAVYRLDDLTRLQAELLGRGLEMPANFFVSLESPEDRWIALPPYPKADKAHLKLSVRDSILTSVGLLIRKPG